MGAGRYERREDRQGYRHGHYRRRLLTRYGEIEDLAVPRTEAGGMGLKARGLMSKHLRLIRVDGCPGLLAALKEICPFQKVQRCLAHRLRNVVVKLKHHRRGPVMAECKAIFAAPTRRGAVRRLRAWSEHWQVEGERAACCLEKDFYHLFHYFDFPKELWKKVRATNLLERTFRKY